MNGPSLTPRGPNLQGPRRQNSPEPYADLVARLVRLHRDLNDVSGSLLRSAGIRVSPDGMNIESALNVLGALDVSGTLNVTGDAVFSGDLAVPNGSISNEALQNPIEEGAIGYSASAFTVPTSAAAVATRTMNIPAGFTQASVMVVVSFGVWNPTTTAGYFYGRATIDGTSGAGLPALVQPSGYGTVTTSAIRTLDSLTPGGQITVSATCNGPSGWGAAASNVVNIDAIAIFRR